MDDTISKKAVLVAVKDALMAWSYMPEWRDEKILKAIAELPSAQPEIIQCKDCKYWVPGYITDNDDFIPPKCGEWQQMVGHSSDDYCSLAERREVTT